MDTSAKIEWIMQCATRLRELMPELTHDEAQSQASEVWEQCSQSLTAKKAAEAKYLHQLGPSVPALPDRLIEGSPSRYPPSTARHPPPR